MELLIGAGVTIVAEVIKKIITKLGKDLGGAVVILLVFALSIGAVVAQKLYVGEILDVSALPQASVQILLTAVGVYELLYKRLIQPALNKVIKK